VARQYGHAHKILEGKPLMEAVDFHAKHLAREALHGALAPVTLPDLVKKYFESIDGEKSKRYVQDLQAKLNRAAKAFTGQLRDIRADDIDKWIKGMEGAGKRTRNSYRMAMVTFFSYAREKGSLPRGKQTEAEFVTRFDEKKGGKIGIYTPEQFATLLRHVDERFAPFVALGGFAGLRSIEILRLEWEDIWFEMGFIEVGREKSKTATRRVVPICPALDAWLKPRAKETGPVLPDIRNEVHFIRLFHAAKGTLNDEKGAPRVKLVRNGLRHSFCSYLWRRQKAPRR